MTLDIRANVFCNHGIVISGNFSDDHIQGTGLIRTRGEVVLKGLVSLRPGDPITLGYERNGQLARIPRALRVLSSFADPFRRQTTVSIGCKLTMYENLRENKQTTPDQDDANSGIPCSEFGKVPINTTFNYIASVCLQQLGLPLASSLYLEGSVAIGSFDYSSGYVSILSDLLYSQSKVGFLLANETLQIVDLSYLPSTGPVYDENDVIDVSPIRSGDLPPSIVIVDYSYNRFTQPRNEEEEEDLGEQQKRNWELDVSQGELEVIYLPYNEGDDLYTASFYPISTTKTEYDDLDRVIHRTETSLTMAAKTNSAYLKELLEETGNFRENTGLAEERVETDFIYQFSAQDLVRPPDNLTPCSGWWSSARLYDDERDQNPIGQVIITYESTMGIAGKIPFETYFYEDGILHPGGIAIPTEVKRVSYETDKEAGITKTITRRSASVIKTQSGQQGFAMIAKDINSSQQAFALLGYAGSLVSTGVSVETHYDRYYGVQKRPSVAQRVKQEYYKDPRSSTSLSEYIHGSAGVGVTATYSVPWSPDDEIGKSATNFYLVRSSGAEALAVRFGRVQQQLTYGHRMGLGVQLVPDKLPPYAASSAFLRLGGIVAKYIVNGQSWTFDSNGIVANVDMVYLGGVGATSTEYRTPSPWAPVQDGITTLPLAPAVTTNIDAAPANSLPTPSGFDPTNPGSIFTTLPTNTAPIYQKETTAPAVVPPYQEVQRYYFPTRLKVDATRTLISVPQNDRLVSAGPRIRATGESFLFPSRTVELPVYARAETVLLDHADRTINSVVRVSYEALSGVAYEIISGDSIPLAGSSINSSTPSLWTQIFNSNVDDAPLQITLPFAWLYNGTSYTSLYLSPNAYITFGNSSTSYTPSAVNPAFPKILINAADNSMQRVYTRTSNNTFRIRYEGNTQTGGTGTTYRVFEIAFFRQSWSNNSSVFEVRMGVSPINTGLFNAYSANAVLSTTPDPTPAPNKSWVFGSSNSTSWSILPAASVAVE